MKTPDEIKKGLLICSGGFGDCAECPYHQTPAACMKLSENALEYIQQLERRIGELTEKVAQLEAAQPKWISVEERLPDVGEKVMVCGVKKGMQVGAFCCKLRPENNRKWWWKNNTILEVTNWMPLPSMPEPQKEDA